MPPSINEDIIEAAGTNLRVAKGNFSVSKTHLPEKDHFPSYTLAEVARHDKPSDAWLIYQNKVLDVTKWVAYHPGGEQTILRFAGMDATDELRSFHGDWVLESKLPHFIIGTVSDPIETTELVKDFRELGKMFEGLGYFRPDPYYYVQKLSAVFAIFSCVLGLLLRTNSTGAHLLAAVLLGVFWQQFAFIGHDCGHMSARVHARDSIDVVRLGALVTFFNGISVAWWKATHNVHHAVPNTVDCDPDIAHLPIFAVHKSMFSSLFNLYHKRVMEFDWIARNIFVPYQHFWYYPIMMVARFNLYLQSALFLASSGDGHAGRTIYDLCAFLGFFVWVSLLMSCIPVIWVRITFLFLSHAVAGLLNVQITLSHFSRPIFDSPTKTENASIRGNAVGKKYGGDFFTRNVISSLDVDCPRYLDWLHGGLQFQTLHHLYPRIARHHLRKTESAISSLCKKHSLPYSRKTFVECNVEVFNTLKETALNAQTWSPLIYESMCAQG